MPESLHPPGPLLAVMGATSVKGNSAVFLQVLGKLLASQTHFRIATSGFRGYLSGDRNPSVAYVLAHAFLDALASEDIQNRVFTYNISGMTRREKFSAGTILSPVGRTPQAQRLHLISQSDVLCLLGGARGTRELYDLALAIERAVLPLPFGGGASKEAWDGHRELIAADFMLTTQTVRHWSHLRLSKYSPEDMGQLANEVIVALGAGVRRRSFIMMPFDNLFDDLYDRVILPAVRLAHFEPIRTDRRSITGDITEYLREEIRSCHCGVAVVTGQNPNVLYELGLAHALEKPVLLLQESAEAMQGESTIPFDIRNHRTVLYPSDFNSEDLQVCIAEIHDTIRNVSLAIPGKRT